MALVAVPPFPKGAWWPGWNSYTTLATQTFDATTDLAVWIAQAPKTGTLDHLEINIAAITTWPSGGVQCGWQGATETAVPTVNNGTFTHSVTVTSSPGAGWWNPGSFVDGGAAKKSVTKGDLLVFAMKPVSGTVSFTVNRLDNTNFSAGAGLLGKFPIYEANTTGTTVASSNALCCALFYDGESAPTPFSHVTPPVLAMTTQTVVNSDRDYAGLLFQVPFSCKCTGLMIRGDIDANVTFRLITDNAGSPLASSIAWDAERRYADGTGYFEIYFTAEVELSINTNYRLIVDNSGSATACAFTVWTVSAAAHRGAWPLGETTALTTSADGTTWADTTTSQPLIAPIISALSDGAGGGGLAIPVSGRLCA
jgi:hypothetical protein